MSSDAEADAEAPPADEVEADGAQVPDEVAPVTDPAQRALLEELTAALGGSMVGSHVAHADLWVRVRAADWKRAVEACRAAGLDYFCFLSGIDWMPHTWPNPKVAEEADGADGADGAEPEPAPDPAPALGDGEWLTGYAGGDTRFQLLARLYSTTRHLGVTLKADLDSADPRVESVATVYPGADWHERETWEMYGFDFAGHPGLTHIYLPGEFEGYPLRKDFPLLAREVKPWPGLVDVEAFPPGTDEEAAPGDEVVSSGEVG